MAGGSLRLACLCSLLACALLAGLAQAGRLKVKRPLFVFGDSVVDTGNNNYLTTRFQANIKPYGFRCYPKSGRFSDGKVLTDFIASRLCIDTPPVSLSNPTDYSKGVNFASAGCGILDTTSPGECLSLKNQTQTFLDLVTANKISPQAVATGVFLVNVGSNDLTLLSQIPPAGVPAYIASMVTGIATFLGTLVATGVRNIIHVNVGPLGCTPFVRDNLGGTSGPLDCNVALNGVVNFFNSLVATAVAAPGTGITTNPNVKLVQYNIFDQALYGFSNPKQFCLKSLSACCGGPGPINGKVPCGKSRVLDGVNFTSTVCRNSNERAFWDPIHPPQKQVNFFADFIWEGSQWTTPAGGAKTFWF